MYMYSYDEDYEDEARSGTRTTMLKEKSPANYATPTKPAVQLRTFFPENWLFHLQSSDDGTIDR